MTANPSAATRVVECSSPDATALEQRRMLFEKLVSIGSRSTDVLGHITALTRDEKEFARLITSLEAHLVRLPPDVSLERVQHEVHDAALHAVCVDVAENNALLQLMRTPPGLASRPAGEVATLTAIADLRPDPTTMLRATDGPFMRFLRDRQKPWRDSVVDAFQKLLTLDAAAPNLVTALQNCASRDDWMTCSRQFEQALTDGKVDSTLPDEWQAIHESVLDSSRSAQNVTALTELLRTPPLLSEMLREEVQAYLGVRTRSRKDEGKLSKKIYGESIAVSDRDRQKLDAQHALNAVDEAMLRAICERFEVRRWAANHCISLRSFVKLNALERQWPHLARLLRTDRALLAGFERAARSKDAVEESIKPAWEKLARDEQLVQFLQVQPLVTEIQSDTVQRYFTVSQTMMPAPEKAGPTSSATVATDAPSPEPRLTFDYLNLHVTIEDAPNKKDLQVTMREPGEGVVAAIEVRDAKSKLKNIRDALSKFNFLDRDVPTMAASGTRALTRERPAGKRSVFRTAENELREIGNALAEIAFPGVLGERIRLLYSSRIPCRILLNVPASMNLLPWEILHLARERVFVGLTNSFSVIRFAAHSEQTLAPITAPLRILAVLSNPKDTAPLNLDGERAVLQQALGAALNDGRVKLEILEHATTAMLQRTLRTVRPHILHFIGHGVYDASSEQGALILESDTGEAELLSADRVSTMLRDHNVAICVLNSCDTGTSSQNDAVTGVAGNLVHAGVPAVVATLREIFDEAGLAFSSELYRAFSDGYTLEAAVAEGRKRLNFGGWDWSAYALFANTSQLQSLVFPRDAVLRSA